MPSVSFPPEIQNGSWISIPTEFQGTSSSYLSTNVTSADADRLPSVVYRPHFLVDGNYSVTIYTPGCDADGTCALRGLVDITGRFAEGLSDSHLNTTVHDTLYQTNTQAKFDQVYYGFVNASSDAFQPSITLTPAQLPSTGSMNVVAQIAQFELVTTEQDSADSTASSTSVPTGNATHTPKATSSRSPAPNSNQSLSTAEIAGLATGLVVAVVIFTLTIVGVWMWRQRRQSSRRPPASSLAGADPHWQGKPELHGEGYHAEKPAHEIHEMASRDVMDPYELVQPNPTHELKGDGQVHEVEGDQRHRQARVRTSLR